MVLDVLDKTASPLQLWLGSCLVAGLGFLSCRRWPAAFLVFAPLALLLTWGLVTMYRDPFVGPAVWREGGWTYAVHASLSTLLALLAPALGLWLGHRKGRGRAR